MARYTADFVIHASVQFDDDGQHDLRDLAFEALEDQLSVNHGFDIELIAKSVKPITIAGEQS